MSTHLSVYHNIRTPTRNLQRIFLNRIIWLNPEREHFDRKKKKKAMKISMLFLKQNQIKPNLKKRKKAQERILMFFYDQFLTSGVRRRTFIFIT